MTGAPQTTEADRLTCRDPDLDLTALERGHDLALVHYKAACVSGSPKTAAAWEALLVASGYGWPATPKEALAHGR